MLKIIIEEVEVFFFKIVKVKIYIFKIKEYFDIKLKLKW